MSAGPRTIVLGASGLIGNFIAGDLARRGLPVVAAARRFALSQRSQFGEDARETPLVALDTTELARILGGADVVVNCLGVLQDSPGDSTHDIHLVFVERLLAAMRKSSHPTLLVHVSMTGADSEDRTAFARSKRAAEGAIVGSGLPYAILRPGFVIAPAAYGGSAMLRSLAAMPVSLPHSFAARPFATVAIEDVTETVALLIRRWAHGEREFSVCWDLLHPIQRGLGAALTSLREWLGTAAQRRLAMPMVLLRLGALAGDAISWLGWRAPIRSTALAELRRGVVGDPRSWMQATGISPRSLDDVLRARPATVQEKWFARLYLIKALIIVTLVVFWCASALIVLAVSFSDATAILTAHGYPAGEAKIITTGGSVMDFCVGVAIAFRRSSRWGLRAGIAVSVFYIVAAAFLTPELWIEPLGALVKTGPAIVLMLVALAIADER